MGSEQGGAVVRQHPEVAWPSGLRRRFKAPVRKGVGSNPTAAKSTFLSSPPTWRGTALLRTASAYLLTLTTSVGLVGSGVWIGGITITV